jgi:cell filamentation protein
VYAWAGKFRSVRISKGGNMFCYPNTSPLKCAISSAAFVRLGIFCSPSAVEFSRRAAEFLGKLNAVHPFRDGNGRSQLAFTALLAAHAGHPIALERLDPECGTPVLKQIEMFKKMHGAVSARPVQH